MKLPNAYNAVIDLKKLKDYCLSPMHPRGKHKARVFKSVLDINQNDAGILKSKILEGIISNDCTKENADIYGSRYSVDILINLKNNSALVRTAWIFKRKEDFPRLTSCYILK